MNAGVLGLIVHGCISIALVVAYVVVTVTGNDASALLGVLGGYVAGAGVQVGLRESSRTPPP